MDDQELANRVRVLRGVDIFSELKKPLLEQLANKVETVELKPGENLIRKGEQGYAMYVITDGHVKVHDGNYEFAKLGKGECFGEYALIDPEVRNASITGATAARLFKLNQDDFYALVDENPGFVNSVLIVLIRRLRKIDEVQKSLAESYLQITNQKEKIEQQNLELSNLNEEKSHLMSIIAHDIRNPLSSSISIAESIQSEMEEKHPEFVEYTEALIRSMWRINEMASKILEVRSEEQKRAQKERESVNLGNLIRDIENDYLQRARKKEITINVETTDVHASLDPMLTRQIIENLVSNAIKFSPLGRQVFLSVEDKAGQAIVIIKDQGPGFTDDDKLKMYTKFQRLSAIPTGGENSLGLGLSIVRKYIDQLDGEIHLESQQGKGARFTLSFGPTLPG
jgi:signal transduction histidine kinase